MNRLVRDGARVGLRAVRTATARTGYVVVKASRTTGPTGLPTTLTFTASPDPAAWIAVEPASLASLPAAPYEESDALHRDVVRRVDALDPAYDFPVVDAAQLGLESTRDRLVWYLSRQRANSYLTCLAFAEACGASFADGALDVGTAAGVLPFAVSQREGAGAAVGWDIDEQYLSVARALFPEAAYEVRGLQDGSRAEAQWPLVFCTQTLEHMAFPGRCLTELLALVRPGGLLVLTVPDGRQDLSPSLRLNRAGASYAGHVNFWSLESWSAFLQERCPGHEITVAISEGRALYAGVRVPDARGAVTSKESAA